MSDAIKIGGCLCGKVVYEFDSSKVISAHHCHCKDCQKSTGSGKATIVMIPEEDLTLSGNLKFYTVTGTAGSHISRGFCEECGSPVISFVTEQPQLRFIKAGSLDNSDWLKIESSFWSVSACKWDPINDSLPSYPKNPN